LIAEKVIGTRLDVMAKATTVRLLAACQQFLIDNDLHGLIVEGKVETRVVGKLLLETNRKTFEEHIGARARPPRIASPILDPIRPRLVECAVDFSFPDRGDDFANIVFIGHLWSPFWDATILYGTGTTLATSFFHDFIHGRDLGVRCMKIIS